MELIDSIKIHMTGGGYMDIFIWGGIDFIPSFESLL